MAARQDEDEAGGRLGEGKARWQVADSRQSATRQDGRWQRWRGSQRWRGGTLRSRCRHATDRWLVQHPSVHRHKPSGSNLEKPSFLPVAKCLVWYLRLLLKQEQIIQVLFADNSKIKLATF